MGGSIADADPCGSFWTRTWRSTSLGAPLPFDLPDPDDERSLEVAIAGGVDAIVTETAQHFRVRDGRLAIPVLWPSEFLRRMGGP